MALRTRSRDLLAASSSSLALHSFSLSCSDKVGAAADAPLLLLPLALRQRRSRERKQRNKLFRFRSKPRQRPPPPSLNSSLVFFAALFSQLLPLYALSLCSRRARGSIFLFRTSSSKQIVHQRPSADCLPADDVALFLHAVSILFPVPLPHEMSDREEERSAPLPPSPLRCLLSRFRRQNANTHASSCLKNLTKNRGKEATFLS